MKNPYGFIISNGVDKDKLNTSRTYLIFADNKDKAYEFCRMYVNKEIEEDKCGKHTVSKKLIYHRLMLRM